MNAIKLSNDGKTVEGYLIRFTDANAKDLDGEYFTKSTYLGEAERVTLLYSHGTNKYIGKIPVGVAKLERRDDGIYAIGTLDIDAFKSFYSDELEAAEKYLDDIKRLVKENKLGWSSGAIGHAVIKANDGQIKQWILAEASLTPTPAEPNNTAAAKQGAVLSKTTREILRNAYNELSKLKDFFDDSTAIESDEKPKILITKKVN